LRSYTPAAGEAVVGTILAKHGDTFSVDINGPCAATLPVLAFESATVGLHSGPHLNIEILNHVSMDINGTCAATLPTLALTFAMVGL